MGHMPSSKLSVFPGVLLLAAAFLLPSFAPAFAAFESRAPRAFLFDVNTRTVLYAQREDERFAPASMAKAMTAATVFQALAQGELTLTETAFVSEDTWRRGGAPSGRATMFAEINSDIPIEDLIRGLTVMVANDAAIALALAVEDSEQAFAARMSEVARQLGAENTMFTNATGEPEPGMHTTVRDLVTTATAMIEQDPDAYRYFSQADFTWNDIYQRNRNPLFGEIEGVDGLFAGYTEEFGYGVVGSVERDGRRVVFALSGVDTPEGRVDEAKRLVRYAFEDFRTVRVAEAGEPIAFARTHGGSLGEVGLIAQTGALDILLPREGEDRVRARVVYDQPVVTPVAAGDTIGQLLVERDGTIIQSTPLVAAQSVETGNVLQRARAGFFELLLGWIPPISFAGSF